MHCPSSRLRIAFLFGLFIFPIPALADETRWEFLLFPEVTAFHHSPVVNDYGVKPHGLQPAASLFVTSTSGAFRFLGEVLLSDQERELERFQLGYQLNASRTLWLGRFHSPIGYWNSSYHHGSHLQTSIMRPALIDYEDEGGVIPSHISGLLWDQHISRGVGELRWIAAVGAAPELGDHTCIPTICWIATPAATVDPQSSEQAINPMTSRGRSTGFPSPMPTSPPCPAKR